MHAVVVTYPACEVGLCAEGADAAAKAVFLVPQLSGKNPGEWVYKAVCAEHAEGWWDGPGNNGAPPANLKHYLLVETFVEAQSPVDLFKADMLARK